MPNKFTFKYFVGNIILNLLKLHFFHSIRSHLDRFQIGISPVKNLSQLNLPIRQPPNIPRQTPIKNHFSSFNNGGRFSFHFFFFELNELYI